MLYKKVTDSDVENFPDLEIDFGDINPVDGGVYYAEIHLRQDGSLVGIEFCNRSSKDDKCQTFSP